MWRRLALATVLAAAGLLCGLANALGACQITFHAGFGFLLAGLRRFFAECSAFRQRFSVGCAGFDFQIAVMRGGCIGWFIPACRIAHGDIFFDRIFGLGNASETACSEQQ